MSTLLSRFVTSLAGPRDDSEHEGEVRAFLYSLTGLKTSGQLRAELSAARFRGTGDQVWIAQIRVEAAELLDVMYGEADPVTGTRPDLPRSTT